MTEPIYVVSGLPRSGTSMMMQMLTAGGIEPLTDGVRVADHDNPRGYYELEAVKKLPEQTAFLDGAGGKVVKIVSELLLKVPLDRTYKVVFMRRPMSEVLRSQQAMLQHRDTVDGADDAMMRRAFQLHIDEVEQFCKNTDGVEVLYVSYARAVADPARQAQRVAKFIDAGLDVDEMVRAVDPSLHRNKGEG